MYIGVTSHIEKRVWEHRNGFGSKFAKNYNLDKLVYAESYDKITEAIAREKQLKKWNRQWKLALIEEANPEWCDLLEGDFQSSWK
ncbi:GIY-YIG nuclease family protein [Terasakiella sp. SH-1]|uniref:GIY-YIG nuclease family protein n=1 Tax=Terasakiella sp. SH-1 TaxID=2560057 RepID=UPI001F0CEE8C|nr:GIY-YIG nuclease family protein [Terasakiella sp. SH-1]